MELIWKQTERIRRIKKLTVRRNQDEVKRGQTPYSHFGVTKLMLIFRLAFFWCHSFSLWIRGPPIKQRVVTRKLSIFRVLPMFQNVISLTLNWHTKIKMLNLINVYLKLLLTQPWRQLIKEHLWSFVTLTPWMCCQRPISLSPYVWPQSYTTNVFMNQFTVDRWCTMASDNTDLKY